MQKDSYGVYTDPYGTRFTTGGGNPPTVNTPITIHTGSGKKSGSWLGSAV